MPDDALKPLGQYKLLKKLGEGGMGAVYLAEDTLAGRLVAIKVLPQKHAADGEFLTRFRREARAAGKLNHPNIVAAYTFGEVDGVHFYVMEYCAGEPLDARLKREQRLSWKDALEIVLQVARGLEYAHKHNLLHRDIKPANIFLADGSTGVQPAPVAGALVPSPPGRVRGPKGPPSTPSPGAEAPPSPHGGEGMIAKILDLGLSKDISETEQTFYTQSGVTLGTPHYISPEQARGEKQIDGRADIYSLGATFYHLITGETPFKGPTAGVVIAMHLTEDLPNPQDVVAQASLVAPASLPVGVTLPPIPDSIVQVIQKMMAKAAADRYANCTEMIADFELLLAGKEPSGAQLDEGKSSVAAVGRFAESPQQADAPLRAAGVPHAREKAGETPAVRRGGPAQRAGSRAARQEAPSQSDAQPEARRGKRGTGFQPGKEHGQDARATKLLYAGLGAAVLILLATVLLLRESGTDRSAGILPAPDNAGKMPALPAAAAPAAELPKQIALDLGDGVKLEMLLIPAGEFTMGDEATNGKPEHKVKIARPFYLGKYEVTQAQYEKLMRANPSQFKGADLPVETVSWDDAKAFCKMATRSTGILPVSGTGWKPVLRLPTEAEWEYACRAGTITEYNTGHGDGALEKACWHNKNSGGKTNPVGKKAPNSWGLYDMHGNVLEWCEDWFDDKYYAASPLADPKGPDKPGTRVLRGGSLNILPGECRSAYRGSSIPGTRHYDVGFRLLLEAPPGSAPVAANQKPETPKPETAVNWINLLPMIDPRRDAVSGEWKMQEGALVTQKSGMGNRRIEIPYLPVEEYDFRIAFSLQEGDCVGMNLSKSGRAFMWLMISDARCSFYDFGKQGEIEKHPSTKVFRFQQNHRYTCVVKVRNGGMSVVLDGQLFSEWNEEYSKLRDGNFNLCSESLLGLSTHLGGATFHSVELLEVTGKGRRLEDKVDDAWVASVQPMFPGQQVKAVVEKLKELNPGYDGGHEMKITEGKVTELNLGDKKALKNIAPLRALKSLHTLHLYYTAVSDLTPLKNMPLKNLNIRDTRVADLSPLKGAPLTTLECYGTRISDLAPLTGMKLTALIAHSTGVRDLAPLKGMPLITLNIRDTSVDDLSPLANAPLQELDCSQTGVSDLTPLKGMPLKWLDVGGTRITDLSPLTGMRLTYFHCTDIADLSLIRDMPLKDVFFRGHTERVIPILKAIPTLETINHLPAAEFWKQQGK